MFPAPAAQAKAETRDVETDRRRPDWVRFALAAGPSREAAQSWDHLRSAGVVIGALAPRPPRLIDPIPGLAGAAWFFG